MTPDAEFPRCDAASVFADVSIATQSEEAQSLWSRLLEEMEQHRVNGAVSYLVHEFQRLAERLDRELTRLESEL
jgi:hypothetical protein